MQELDCILNHPMAAKHIILIDDVRSFTGQNDYPTLKSLEDFVSSILPNNVFEVKDDIIRINFNNPE